MDKKKHQIEAGVLPVTPFKAMPDSEEIKRKSLTEWSKKNYPMEHPTEEDTIKQYRQNPFDRGVYYCYIGDANCWFNKGVRYECIDTSEYSTTFIDKNDNKNAIDINSALKYFAWDKDKYTIEKPKEDRVNHPSHYTWLKDLCGIEVIDITRHLPFDLGNAIKYILRAGHKTEDGYSNTEKEIEDIKKSIFYLNDYINNILNDKG